MYRYFPHTSSDLQAMQQAVGIGSPDELFADIPAEARLQRDYDLPASASEMEVRRFFEGLAQESGTPRAIFAGAGCYNHYTPSIVKSLTARSEFLTSYTPYQAEISQGTLHYIFEYQSMIAELTQMDISNASMYDGATATAEAAMMAWANAKKATCVAISATVDPKVRQVVETYAHFHGFAIQTIAATGGTTDREALSGMLAKGGVAGVIVQQPNYYGIVEDLTGIADEVHAQKGLFIVNANPFDLALLRTPGEWGADIAVGEGQSLGIPMTLGGPGVGYMACSEKLMRKMPGRIVGQTLDNRGQRAFVLTLQAREQHIRRQKATSNICSNQSLMALFVTIYLATMGPEGLREAAQQSYTLAHELHDMLVATGRFKPTFASQPFFNEFCLDYDGDLDVLCSALEAKGIVPGVRTGLHTIMIAATEQNTRQQLHDYVQTVKAL